MRLTGKANKLFQSYYIDLIRKERKDYDYLSNQQILEKFYRLLPSQRWGIFQDWADSMGIQMYVASGTVNKSYQEETTRWSDWIYVIRTFQKTIDIDHRDGHKTRQEARNAAIDKLNEIVNEL